MGRRLVIRNRKVAAARDRVEDQARAKYLRVRLIPGTDYVITDAALYPVKGSAGLRAAADKALEVELEASTAEVKKP